MPFIHDARLDIPVKLVFFGPAKCGKSTCVQYVHGVAPPGTAGKLATPSTECDRIMRFELRPPGVTIRRVPVCFEVLTFSSVYDPRALGRSLMAGVAGLLFVADSREERGDDNLESKECLLSIVADLGVDPAVLPMVYLYNKRDLPTAMSVDAMDAVLNPGFDPSVETIAHRGIGVYEAFDLCARLVLRSLETGAKPGLRA
jgi:hypothetical protein